jgi:hypothetical protein
MRELTKVGGERASNTSTCPGTQRFVAADEPEHGVEPELRKIYVGIEAWRNQRIEGEDPCICLSMAW